ncbi:hypothetical protein NGF19_25440 [Streptomyces sp. RY43-2]|uniref:Secreted protein n=1 Tax=Streptomyces macrolidinus TaxID=2952607 RepID=A0ABT0ZKF8_9ACTN|nr:hypothetical protein [Streptomyces macrolidinus]MCN9244083.1 hypothetical protein [Streptomyces macrolidinus]
MIGVRLQTWPPGRAGRIGLLLGLVMLVTAHLAGSIHAASFGGPHSASADVDRSRPATADADHGFNPAPGHDHKADGHIDHAVDRPRDTVDGAVSEPGHDTPDTAPPTTARAEAAHAAWTLPPRLFPVPDGRATLALHCVLRQ